MAARHPDALDAGGVGALHVARRVAHDDGLLRIDVVTVDEGCPLERDAGDLAPIARVGAVAAEREEPVEPCPMQLDVRGGLDVSGHDPEQVAAVEQPRQHLLDARQDSVGGRACDRLVHVVQAPFQQPGELGPLRRSVHHRLERPSSHIGIGHPRVGELADVGRYAIQLVERQSPGGRTCAAGVDQRTVDVEQDRDPFGSQGNLLERSVVRPARHAPTPARHQVDQPSRHQRGLHRDRLRPTAKASGVHRGGWRRHGSHRGRRRQARAGGRIRPRPARRPPAGWH